MVMVKLLKKAQEKALRGEGLTFEEGCELTGIPEESIFEVLPFSASIRRRFKGKEVNLCSIVNAKSGLCNEDCSFLSMATRYSTGIPAYRMMDSDKIVESAQKAAEFCSREFSIVTSGPGIEKERDVSGLTDAV